MVQNAARINDSIIDLLPYFLQEVYYEEKI